MSLMASNSSSRSKVAVGSTATALTRERRSEIARNAARARWNRDGASHRLNLLRSWLGPLAPLAVRRDFLADLNTV
jgi:hypothetical protein